jgi:hypothetical protein
MIMPWEIPSSNYDPESIDKGFQPPEPGRYHVQVTGVDEEAETRSGKPQMTVDFEILAGTPKGQEGRTHREYFVQSEAEGAVNRVLIFALATKLITYEELKQHKERGSNPVIDFSRAVDRQLCLEIEHEEYEGKKRARCGYRMFAVDSPRSKGIPLNKGMLVRAGDAGDDPFEASGPMGPGKEVGSDKWDDVF